MLPYFTTFVHKSFSPTYSAEPAVDNRRISWFVHPVIQDESVFRGFPLLDDTGADNVGNGGPRHDVEGRKGELYGNVLFLVFWLYIQSPISLDTLIFGGSLLS